MSTALTDETALILRRVIAAPRERVYDAFTRVEDLEKWFGCGPGGQTHAIALDVRPGGAFRYRMDLPGGDTMYGKWIFTEVKPVARLVTIASITDEHGAMIGHSTVPDWPLELEIARDYLEENGSTVLTLRIHPVNATEVQQRAFEASLEGMYGMFEATLDRIEALVV